jgi:hypothetical protein
LDFEKKKKKRSKDDEIRRKPVVQKRIKDCLLDLLIYLKRLRQKAVIVLQLNSVESTSEVLQTMTDSSLKSLDVVGVGACNADLFTYTTKMPVRGETVTGTAFAQGWGGKNHNQVRTTNWWWW